MKHLQKCGRGKLCVFLTALLVAFSSAYAQDYEEHRKHLINKLDFRN